MYLAKKLCVFLFRNRIKVQIILTITTVYAFYISSIMRHPVYSNIVIGIFSSLLLLLFFDIYQLITEYYKFQYLYGTFYRVEFLTKTPDTTGETPFSKISNYYDSINRLVTIHYKGTGIFTGIAEYQEGDVNFELSLDGNTPSVGQGSYNYITTRQQVGINGGRKEFNNYTREIQKLDFGEYRTHKYSLNVDLVVLYHRNTAPSSTSEGYEILLNKRILDRSLTLIKKAIDKKVQLKIQLYNSHDYRRDDQFIIIEPYYIVEELSSNHPTLIGMVKSSLSGDTGQHAFSIPYLSTIAIHGSKFTRTSEITISNKFRRTYPN